MSHIHSSHRIALLAGAFAALATATPAMAGCNSGNVAKTSLLSSVNCQANASAGNATAVGSEAAASGFGATAVGAFARADFGTSVGFNTRTLVASTAIGTEAQATGDSSTALGRVATASAHSALALGNGAVAARARSVALGSGSLANVADTVSVGTTTARRRIVNLAHGVGNTDAATLGQVKAIATAAAQAEIASAAGSTTIINDMQRELSDLRALVKQQQARLDRQHQEIAELKVQRSAALAE